MTNSTIKEKNHSIEALRFLFMLVICCWHRYGSEGLFPHGYLAVEFYFILSGYLLYKSFSKPNSLSTIDYTLKKVKRFAPEYLAVVAYIYLRHSILPVIMGHREFDIAYAMRIFPEMLMLQDCGFYEGGANNPMWYLCILVIGGGLIYSFLKYDKRLSINILLPLICIMGYTYIFGRSVEGKIEVWDVDGFVKGTLLRGLSGLSLGVLIAYIMERKQECLIIWHKTIMAAAIVCFGMLIFTLTAKRGVYYDRYALLFIPPIILSCFAPNSWFVRLFASRMWTLLGGITFEMLLLHYRIVIPIHESLISKIEIPLWLNYVFYCILTIMISYLFKKLFEIARRICVAYGN